jgi:hypothetical protein
MKSMSNQFRLRMRGQLKLRTPKAGSIILLINSSL